MMNKQRPIADRPRAASAHRRLSHPLPGIFLLIATILATLPVGAVDGTPIRVGIADRVAHALLTLALADEAQTFELVSLNDEEGIGRDPIAAIADGELDLLATTADTLLAADASGVALRGALLLAISLDGDALLVDTDRARERLPRGARIGVSSGSAGLLLLSSALQRRGLSIDELEVLELSPDEALTRWLDASDETTRLDALVLAEPTLHGIVAAAATSGRPLTRIASGNDSRGLITDLVAGEERWLRANREALATLIRAWDRTIGALRRGLSSARRQALADSLGIPEDELRGVLNSLQPLSTSDNIELLRGEYQKSFSSMSEVLARRDRVNARGVPSANRFLELGSLRRIAAGR